MLIQVKVNPWASSNSVRKQIDLEGNEIYFVRIKSLPIAWQANKELISILAEYFNLDATGVKIVSWATSQRKKVLLPI